MSVRFCDLKCPHAKWPESLADGSKTCRTFIALYCEKLGCLVDKNGVCTVDGEEESSSGWERVHPDVQK